MAVSKKMKPCPWCASEDIYTDYDGEYIVAFHCGFCGATKPVDLLDEYSPQTSNDLAVASWNRRWLDVENIDRMVEAAQFLTEEW